MKSMKEFLEDKLLAEKAPPGMEHEVRALKKKFPGDEGRAFAIAWSQYNKKHGKTHTEEVEKLDSFVDAEGFTYEQLDEKYVGFSKLKAKLSGHVSNPGAVAAAIGRKKYGKKKFQNAAAHDHKMRGESTLADKFAKRHIEMIADTIRNMDNEVAKIDKANHFADILAERYESFDVGSFYESAGLEEATRKDFVSVANTLSKVEDPDMRRRLAYEHAKAFAKTNNRFNHEKFFKAAGVPLYKEEVEYFAEESGRQISWTMTQKGKQNALLTKHKGEEIIITTSPTSVGNKVGHVAEFGRGMKITYPPGHSLGKVQAHIASMLEETDLNEDEDDVRRPTDNEYSHAKKHLQSKGYKLDSIGVHRKTGMINAAGEHPTSGRKSFQIKMGEQIEGEETEQLDEFSFHVKHGAFHRWLGKKEGEEITNADIEKGLAAGGHAAKMANFAKNARKFHHEEVELTESPLVHLVNVYRKGNSRVHVWQNALHGYNYDVEHSDHKHVHPSTHRVENHQGSFDEIHQKLIGQGFSPVHPEHNHHEKVDGEQYKHYFENYEFDDDADLLDEVTSKIAGADIVRALMRKHGHTSIYTNKHKMGHSIKTYGTGSPALEKDIHTVLTKVGIPHGFNRNGVNKKNKALASKGTNLRFGPSFIVHLPHKHNEGFDLDVNDLDFMAEGNYSVESEEDKKNMKHVHSIAKSARQAAVKAMEIQKRTGKKVKVFRTKDGKKVPIEWDGKMAEEVELDEDLHDGEGIYSVHHDGQLKHTTLFKHSAIQVAKQLHEHGGKVEVFHRRMMGQLGHSYTQEKMPVDWQNEGVEVDMAKTPLSESDRIVYKNYFRQKLEEAKNQKKSDEDLEWNAMVARNHPIANKKDVKAARTTVPGSKIVHDIAKKYGYSSSDMVRGIWTNKTKAGHAIKMYTHPDQKAQKKMHQEITGALTKAGITHHIKYTSGSQSHDVGSGAFIVHLPHYEVKEETVVSEDMGTYDSRSQPQGSWSNPNSEHDSNPGYVVGVHQINGKIVKMVRMGGIFAPVKIVQDDDTDWRDKDGKVFEFQSADQARDAYWRKEQPATDVAVSAAQSGQGGQYPKDALEAESSDPNVDQQVGANE